MEIEEGVHADEFSETLNANRQGNQQLDEEMLSSQGSTWGKLRWPALLQKLLEKCEFEVGEGQKEIGCLLQHAAKMVWGADAVGYYDMREDKEGEIIAANNFEFMFIDGAASVGENGEMMREITIFYEMPDESIGELRPDMSQAEMIAFMGRPQSNGDTWSRQDLIQEISRREGWQFCNYWGIRKSIKPPYQLPRDKVENYGRAGMTEDVGAVEAVYDGTHFIRGIDRNEWLDAILECGDVPRDAIVRIVNFYPGFGGYGDAGVYDVDADSCLRDRGAVRVLRG